LKIAPILNLSIEVVHAYSGLFDANETFVIRAGMGREESLLYDMDYFINVDKAEENSVMVLPELKITKRLLYGMPDIELLKLSKEKDCAMIVMGTTGSHDIAGKLFGSISTEMAQNARCPVILVPKNPAFEQLKHILFASNYESATLKLINNGLQWANKFKSNIHFVHISETGNLKDFTEIKEIIFDTFSREKDSFVASEIKNLHAYSVSEGLHRYIDKKQINLLMMVAPKRKFLQNIFQKNTTKEMAFSINIPMVVLHA
jgi:nucleotide-binding universal stress UspA family protein